MSASFEFQSAVERPLTALSSAFAQAFAGYFVPVPDDPNALAARIRSEQIDLAASFVALANGTVAGLCLVARRGEVSRVAGMGVTPAWRGRGASGAIMRHLLDGARARGDSRALLEVIEDNVTAVRLYQKHGFQKTRRLVGYEASLGEGGAGPGIRVNLQEISVLDVAAEVAQANDQALPWQLQAATLAGITRPTRAFRLGQARCLALIQPQAVVLRALFVAPPDRRRGEGTRLLQALAHEFPGRRLSVAPIVPEGLADEFMRANGFQHSELAQFEMVCELN